uniref:U34-Liphistoxin-Lm1a_1 n=1 Tax=Liphistius malayanus TaxID=1203467 RepID=A0A482ZHZ0_9ARAC
MAVGLVVLLFKCALVELLQTKRAHKMFRVELAGHGSDTATADWFVTPSTKRTTFCMVMKLTVRLAFVVKETSSIEWLPTVPADKASRMPLTIHCRDIVFCDWTITASTFESKHLQVIISTVWFAILFMKTIFSKLFSTLSTEEMLWMPCFVQCSYTFTKNGSITVGTFWRKYIMIIFLTIWHTITLKEVLCSQF